MRCLILVAHGSRRSESNDEVIRVAADLREAAGEAYVSVCHAFLELATPSIPEAIDNCITAGASEVIVLPYFLAAGRHVREDIPQIIADKQAEYPEATIRLTSHLGTAPGLPSLLLSLARSF